jgi:hypothetical protein
VQGASENAIWARHHLKNGGIESDTLVARPEPEAQVDHRMFINAARLALARVAEVEEDRDGEVVSADHGQ